MLEDLLGLMQDGQIRKLMEGPHTDWHSLKVRYETPHVDRLWTQLENGTRLYLHRIHPCVKPLLHPHPWPSAVMVMSGTYVMNVAYASPAMTRPPAPAATMVLSKGSGYEMLNPWGWHSVQPVGAPSLSLMITGKPWPNEGKHPGKGEKHETMTVGEVASLFSEFEALEL